MLTRDEDRSLSIEERIALANALDADLFVSIHCNASTESSSHGIETYFASRASSRKALKVAARENGVPLARMSDLEATLYGESMTPKIAKSNQLADMIQKSVVQELGSRISQSEDRGVRRAPLSILLGAKMPAVVLECAFMSNRQDRRNLNNSGYLKRLSEGIALGISSCVQDMNRTDVRSLSARKGD
jgi:N-acetylmuramoyl-L-alanine amidase